MARLSFRNGDLLLHCLDWGGDGPPLIFLHGGSAHAHWWDFVAPSFVDSFRVLALDLRGHGDSEWAKSYQVEDYESDVGALVAELGLDRPALVGHSLGAFVALRYALHHPRDLRALAVVDGRASLGEAGSRYLQLLRMFLPAEYRSLEEAARRFRLLPRQTSAAREVIEHVARWSFRHLEDGMWAAKFDPEALTGQEPFDFRDRLHEIECPVLIARGEKSPVLSARAANELVGLCRDARGVEIADAYHHVLLDRPAELTQALAEFLPRA
ncbi:MAG: hypothetical protein QOD06_660 [Candidatus Binatota bacterium]|nr:hypothetical protein [Candidatus Binatota bacterium]